MPSFLSGNIKILSLGRNNIKNLNGLVSKYKNAMEHIVTSYKFLCILLAL